MSEEEPGYNDDWWHRTCDACGTTWQGDLSGHPVPTVCPECGFGPPAMSEPTEREPLRTAEEALSLAMLRLGGEAPSTVYDERGYAIWVASVAADITEPFRTALRAAENRADVLDDSLDKMKQAFTARNVEVRQLKPRLAAAESSLTRYKTALQEIANRNIPAGATWGRIARAALEESPEDRDQ